jgi:hypothetical protein
MNPNDLDTIKTLVGAAESVQTKSEIQSVLNSIITDIEIKNEIETSIHHQLEIKALRGRCECAEQALEEYKLLEMEKKDKARCLLEDLVNDLGGLNGFLAELEKTRNRKSAVGDLNKCAQLNEYGAVANDDDGIDEEREQKRRTNDNNNDIQGVSNLDSTTETQGSSLEKGGESSTAENTSIDKPSKKIQVIEKEAAAENETNSPTSTTVNDAGADANAETKKTAPKKKMVKRKKIIKRRPPPTLQSLNSATLMNIFEFMDALDIVNMAQTNVRMYSKVDNIFGLGGAGFDADGRDEDVDFDQNSIEEEIFEEVEVEEEVEDVEEILDTTPTPNASESMTRPASVQSFGSAEHATIVSIPSAIPAKSATAPTETAAPTPKARNPTISTSTESIPTIAKNENTNVITSTTKPTSSSSVASSSSAMASSTSGSYQISQTVATAIADKLSPIELTAIITMRDQLRMREQEMAQMRDEFKSLNAALDGTMSVKEVLTVKVKEQQLALNQNKEIAAKTSRQTSSDQEVIAFLDERVQELEGQVGNFDDERLALQNEMDKIKKASEKQLAVLGDMLTFEREQMADHEKDWKSTKKVLVKEVKHCRAQILALEAERDGIYEENVKLKDALLSVGSTSNRSKSFDIS